MGACHVASAVQSRTLRRPPPCMSVHRPGDVGCQCTQLAAVQQYSRTGGWNKPGSKQETGQCMRCRIHGSCHNRRRSPSDSTCSRSRAPGSTCHSSSAGAVAQWQRIKTPQSSAHGSVGRPQDPSVGRLATNGTLTHLPNILPSQTRHCDLMPRTPPTSCCAAKACSEQGRGSRIQSCALHPDLGVWREPLGPRMRPSFTSLGIMSGGCQAGCGVKGSCPCCPGGCLLSAHQTPPRLHLHSTSSITTGLTEERAQQQQKLKPPPSAAAAGTAHAACRVPLTRHRQRCSLSPQAGLLTRDTCHQRPVIVIFPSGPQTPSLPTAQAAAAVQAREPCGAAAPAAAACRRPGPQQTRRCRSGSAQAGQHRAAAHHLVAGAAGPLLSAGCAPPQSLQTPPGASAWWQAGRGSESARRGSGSGAGCWRHCCLDQDSSAQDQLHCLPGRAPLRALHITPACSKRVLVATSNALGGCDPPPWVAGRMAGDSASAACHGGYVPGKVVGQGMWPRHGLHGDRRQRIAVSNALAAGPPSAATDAVSHTQQGGDSV